MTDEQEKYARIYELLKNHHDVPSTMTSEVLSWLDDIVPVEHQTTEKADWEKEIC
jgi:hypothetical protein